MVATALPAEKTSISTVEKKVYSTATLEDTFIRLIQEENGKHDICQKSH